MLCHVDHIGQLRPKRFHHRRQLQQGEYAHQNQRQRPHLPVGKIQLREKQTGKVDGDPALPLMKALESRQVVQHVAGDEIRHVLHRLAVQLLLGVCGLIHCLRHSVQRLCRIFHSPLHPLLKRLRLRFL